MITFYRVERIQYKCCVLASTLPQCKNKILKAFVSSFKPINENHGCPNRAMLRLCSLDFLFVLLY